MTSKPNQKVGSRRPASVVGRLDGGRLGGAARSVAGALPAGVSPARRWLLRRALRRRRPFAFRGACFAFAIRARRTCTCRSRRSARFAIEVRAVERQLDRRAGVLAAQLRGHRLDARRSGRAPRARATPRGIRAEVERLAVDRDVRRAMRSCASARTCATRSARRADRGARRSSGAAAAAARAMNSDDEPAAPGREQRADVADRIERVTAVARPATRRDDRAAAAGDTSDRRRCARPAGSARA